MANGPGRGPRSDSPGDLYAWAVAHDVEVQGYWNRQWKDNDTCDTRTSDTRRRLRTVEDSIANIRGRIAVYAAVGAVAGGAIASVIINLVLR